MTLQQQQQHQQQQLLYRFIFMRLRDMVSTEPGCFQAV